MEEGSIIRWMVREGEGWCVSGNTTHECERLFCGGRLVELSGGVRASGTHSAMGWLFTSRDVELWPLCSYGIEECA